MKKVLLALLLALSGSTAALATVATVNYTDLWWSPAEPGWGVTITQQHTTLFLTFYVYDRDGTPTWAVAQLERTGSGAAGQPVFSGGLSTTTGARYGAPHHAPSARSAGTATFAPTDAVSARLDYTIDGMAVGKSIRRQTLVNDDLSGTYVVFGDLDAVCGGAGSASTLLASMVTITHVGTRFTYREWIPDDSTFSCTWSGTSVHEGQLARASGTMSCTDGASGTFAFSEIASNALGFTARVRLDAMDAATQCTLSGAVSGLKQ